ncbi:MAG: polysaccharide biosynthesis C-terminal domain-containing protein, partial [Bacillales bacterium]|nr:polysaccharide biosynthesis C-terminal domain-containing protein [Bacillales bacterium]
ATAIGYTVSIIINLVVIKAFTSYSYRVVFRRTLLILLFNLLMSVGVAVVYQLLKLFMNPASKLQSLIMIAICAFVGASVYFYLSYRTKLIGKMFGNRAALLGKKLRLSRGS